MAHEHEKVLAVAPITEQLSFGQAEISDAHMEAINRIQRERGKPELAKGDVLVRPMRMAGTKVTSIFTRFKREDLAKLAEQVPGAPLLVGHNNEMEPVGTFYMAFLTDEGEDTWLDGWFYVLNDDEGRKFISKVDGGVINEASIAWTYTEAICSICGLDYWGYEADESGQTCQHFRGVEYGDSGVCYIWTTGDVQFIEGSAVYRGAHPGTRVGGDWMRAAASRSSCQLTFIDVDKRKKAMLTSTASQDDKAGAGEVAKANVEPDEVAFVPSDPSDYSLDESPEWTRPVLADFIKSLGLEDGTKWPDLTDGQRAWIASHFAYAPSSTTTDYAFSDLKLPHHRPGDEYPASFLVWGGVKAAAQRLAVTDIPSDEVDKVKDHLARHYEEFNRTAPWADESKRGAWEQYVELMKKLASGFAVSDDFTKAAELASALFDDQQKGGEEEVTLELKFGEEVRVFDGDAEAITGELQAAIDELIDAMKAKLDEVRGEAEAKDKMARLGEAYVKDLVSEIERLAVAADGADEVEGYMRAISALAERADVEALRAERDRLKKKVEEFPNERLSREVATNGEPAVEMPSKELDSFKQN